MMVIKLATTTCFGPSNGHYQVVHSASRVYTLCIRMIEISSSNKDYLHIV